MKRVLATAFLSIVVSACGGSSSSAPTPTPPALTRIIGLSGNLAFGNIPLGSSSSATLTITNSGNSMLTITGMTVPSANNFVSTFITGTIAAGGSQSATVRFTPTTAQTYSGTWTVNGDQTSGTNTISVSGIGTSVTPPPPSLFSVSGAVTDGTSHGILPKITVQVVSGTNVGMSAVTDAGGNYSMSGLSAGTFTLSAAAVSYQTTTQPVTLSANTRVDLVLQRTSTPPPTPIPTPTPPPISPIPSSCTAGPYKWDANPNVLRCRNRLGQFAPSACCGR